MQHLEVSGAVRHIYIYIYVIRRLKVKLVIEISLKVLCLVFRRVHKLAKSDT